MATDNLIHNARYSNISQIAETFIPNDQYLELIKPVHSIITGPRGCGKTTLLKMLTPNAVDIIIKNQKKIPIASFVGIYIPADKQWLRQHVTLKKRISDENVYKPLIKCLINSNCFISTINTIDYLLRSKVQEETILKELETEISREIKNSLNLPNDFPNTFYHLKVYFYKVINDLNIAINKYFFGYLFIKDISPHNIAFVEITDIIQPIYESFYKAVEDAKVTLNRSVWALCFDELEISPSWLISDLISTYFRSTYQNLILKVTGTPIISPITESVVSAPQLHHDFNRIDCWIYDANSRRRWVSFCENYIRKKYDVTQINELLGVHDYTKALEFSEKDLSADSGEIKEWAKGSTMWKVMVRLAKIDSSFKEFLLSKGIDPENPIPQKGQTDTIHRKIKPLISFRYYFKKIDSKRSRKAVHLYYGVEHLFELTDGNPRMFLNLLSKYDYYFRNQMTVPINVQAQQIFEFSNEVYVSLKDDPEGYSFNDYSLQRFLDKIGNFVYREIIERPFTPDPNSCFTVENNVPENIKRLVIYGLETGALQLIVTPRDTNINSIVDRRIRLSYALHPIYRIPKRTYTSVRLDYILKQNDSLTLFDNEM